MSQISKPLHVDPDMIDDKNLSNLRTVLKEQEALRAKHYADMEKYSDLLEKCDEGDKEHNCDMNQIAIDAY